MEVHEPVLAETVMKYLNVKKGGTYIDATLNGGGHARKILEMAGDRGMVLGIDRDPKLIQKMGKEDIKGLVACVANYSSMGNLIQKLKIKKVDGILFDFGLSSWHLQKSKRGFSFQKDEKLDMRFSEEEDIPTAASIINSYSEDELARIFSIYGEEPRSRQIAKAVVLARRQNRIITTGRLTEIISKNSRGAKAGRHPATRVFQALRIAVNQELENIQLGLDAAMRIVAAAGRIVAISFHSLEDRIVKNKFRETPFGMPLTKKPVRANRQEILKNPRSRSARLRAWEKIV